VQRPASSDIGDDLAVVLLVDGEYAEIDRRRGSVVIHATRSLEDHDLVHPYLAAPAAILAQWRGRVALHAGGLVVNGGVWALLGERGAGKTTTLMACTARGLPVFADDLVIVEGHTAFAGPRSLDLRPETAERLGPGKALVRVREGERARLVLPPIEPELPFRGCVVLDVAESVEMATVPPAERLHMLSRHVMVSDRAQQPLLDLLALPMWSLRRPRSWDRLPQAVEALVATLSDR
jgi:hypothetical protein